MKDLSKGTRLIGDADFPYSCETCHEEVVHCSGNIWDYFVYCSNTECINHKGEDVGDMECPDWAHGWDLRVKK